MMIVVVSAGHSLKEEGAISGDIHENLLNMHLRDQVVKQLNDMGVATIVPNDSMNLRETIAFIKRSTYDAAIEIHYNAGQASAHGVEAFHKEGDPWGKRLCENLCGNLSSLLGQRSRGAKSEIHSAHRRLGFVHENPHCVLIEAAFVTNPEDVGLVLRDDDGKLWATIVAQTIADHLSGTKVASYQANKCGRVDPGSEG